jgi:hypothetical protein
MDEIALPAALVFLVPAASHAECLCQCVNGEMQPLCQSTMDLPPLCPPRLCPLDGPALAPHQRPTLPPIGTTDCGQARVCDTYGNCSWQTVCQ